MGKVIKWRKKRSFKRVKEEGHSFYLELKEKNIIHYLRGEKKENGLPVKKEKRRTGVFRNSGKLCPGFEEEIDTSFLRTTGGGIHPEKREARYRSTLLKPFSGR